MGRNNLFKKWWRKIDKWLLFTIIAISIIGIILIASASPSIAQRIKLPPYYFLYRHLIYLLISFFTMFLISNLNEVWIRYVSTTGFTISILLLVAVLYSGIEIKGSHRWIRIFGISLQPSEFIKTFFVTFNAILLSKKEKLKYVSSFLTYSLLVLLIMSEPDFGMTVIITIIFIGQLFICGISIRYILFSGMLMLLGGIVSYFTISHIQYRINNFFNQNLDGNFQVNQSLEAFKHGGLIGTGLGEGIVKFRIPDSHTDFIFAVAGEEFGALFCLLIIILFLFFTIKLLNHIIYSTNSFQKITVTGIVIQIVLPALINMGVSLNLLPTKGMVLPFISYGGSSVLASSIALGIVLSLTKIKFFAEIR